MRRTITAATWIRQSAWLTAVALAIAPVYPHASHAKSPPVADELRAIAAMMIQVADATNNRAARLAAEQIGPSLAALSSEELARLDPFRREVQIARSAMARLVSKRPGNAARSGGYPSTGTNDIYDSSGCTTALTHEALVVAQVADGILAGASHGCEVTAPFPACTNVASACIPFAIAASVARIFFNQRDLCGAVDDRLQAEAMKDQLGHVHADLENVVSDLSSRKSSLHSSIDARHDSLTSEMQSVQNRITALRTTMTNDLATLSTQLSNHTANINSRATQIDNEVAAHRTNLDNRATKIDNELIALQAHLTNRTNIADAEVDNSTNLARTLGAKRREAIEISSIERVMSEQHIRPIGYFILPAAFGGHLELVREFVDDAIQAAIGIGKDPVGARAYLVRGDDANNSGQYKAAHIFYRRAYRETVR